ncbi:MAG: hypothetical protein HPY45_10335 [Anaerolineae bacterium]|nr:hypothetical protein [Anaerolineae bacterium]
MVINFILWYLVILIAGWLSFPLAYRLFGLLSDRGHGLSKPLSLLLWGYLFWMLSSLHVIQNDIGGILFAALVLVVVNMWLGKGIWREIRSWIAENRKVVVVSELLFLISFGVWAVVRAANPEILGTEKPMELAFINAILRSPQFPPHDPWLSGYAISYYYFGYVIVAMLARVTAVSAGVAFNLAVSSWFALTAIAAYSVLYSLFSGAATRRDVRTAQKGKFTFASLLAPFFILIVGNLEGFLEVLHARGIFWTRLADGGWYSKFWSWLRIMELDQPPTPPFGWVPERVSGIWWWRASRVVQDFDMAGQAKEIIDEIPIFSFILSDLHPHVLAMPFAILAVGLSLNLFYKGSAAYVGGFGLGKWVSKVFSSDGARLDELNLFNWITRTDFWAAALIFGGLAFLNTWDFPIYLGLFSATYVFLKYSAEGWGIRRIWEFFEVIVYIVIAGVLIYLPFYTGFSSQAGGILPSLSFYTRGVYFWVMFAPLILPCLVWFIWLWRKQCGLMCLRQGLKFSLSVVFGLWIFSYVLAGVFILLVSSNLFVPLQPLVGMLYSLHGVSSTAQLFWGSLGRRFAEPGTWVTLLFLLVLVWGLLSSYRHGTKSAGSKRKETVAYSEQGGAEGNVHEPPATPFVLLLALVGMGLTLVPEFVYLRDQFGWRINTIFKFYFQAWILWGIAAGFASGILLGMLETPWKNIFRLGWVALLLMAMAYPVFGIWTKTEGFSPSYWTLDGTAHIRKYAPDEMNAIEWLQQAPIGVLAEAIGGSYSGYARISTHSGMPTVLGWPGHESQWRGGSKEMAGREEDIELLYRTSRWEEALGVIQRYSIRYIYVGSLERSKYRANENKFIENLKPVFQSGADVIYEVPSSLVPNETYP